MQSWRNKCQRASGNCMTALHTLFSDATRRHTGPRVKFCGFTHPDDVQSALLLGIDAYGFNLARGPRKISVEVAANLVALVPRSIMTVALFVDADEATILSAMHKTHCAAVQLHGNETPELAERLRTRFPVIKAFSVRDAESLAAIHQYPADIYLLDAAIPGQVGGTGVSWDHRLLHNFSCAQPWMIAGGLNALNAAAATTTATTMGAWGLDVSSGIEKNPGRKDAQLMEEFMRAVHSVVQ